VKAFYAIEINGVLVYPHALDHDLLVGRPVPREQGLVHERQPVVRLGTAM